MAAVEREEARITETYKAAIDKYGLISALERLDYAENEINLFYLDNMSRLAVAIRQADVAWKRLGPVIWDKMPMKPSEIYRMKAEAQVPTTNEMDGQVEYEQMSPRGKQKVQDSLVASVVEEAIDEAHEKIIAALQEKNLYLKQSRLYSKKNFPRAKDNKWRSQVSSMAEQGT